MSRRVFLVGESNPYGGDPFFALYPDPVNSAGWRLCEKVLGVSMRDYLNHFERRNLVNGKWSTAAAAEGAYRIKGEARQDDVLVLLGVKVAKAFGFMRPTAFTSHPDIVGAARVRVDIILLPHPSGRCLTWNEPGAYEKARRLITRAAAWLVTDGVMQPEPG